MRYRFLAGAALAVALLVGGLLAAPEDVSVGDVRAVLPRDGTALREQPHALAPRTATLAYGTQVRVAEVRERWIRVTPVEGDASRTGWLKTGQTVEPFALTQGGQAGALAAREREPSQADISAAGRQFDEATEADYRREHPDLKEFYPLVDRIEAAKPAPEEVDRFILEGRLGRPQGGAR